MPALSQTPLTWDQVKARFETANPTLRAGQLNIAESKASEITAFLRPNPNMTFLVDQFQPFNGNPYRPFGFLLPLVSFDYLHERQHKRELRLASAQEATAIAESQQLDLERTMLFTLRSAFIQTLQAKQLLLQAQENLDYYNKELSIFRSRFQTGGIALWLDRSHAPAACAIRERLPGRADQRPHRQDHSTSHARSEPVTLFDVTGPFESRDQVLLLEGSHYR
jgi:cobalt-zinc-cadmium efflux system outer membrane protein